MSKGFVYLHDAKELINEFAIDYMVHPTFHANKAFKEQVEKYMNDTFGTITQPFIINTTKKKNICVLALLMFYETKHKYETKVFIVLSCVIYIIIENYVCIENIACQSKQLSDICIDRKYLEKV